MLWFIIYRAAVIKFMFHCALRTFPLNHKRIPTKCFREEGRGGATLQFTRSHSEGGSNAARRFMLQKTKALMNLLPSLNLFTSFTPQIVLLTKTVSTGANKKGDESQFPSSTIGYSYFRHTLKCITGLLTWTIAHFLSVRSLVCLRFTRSFAVKCTARQ